MAAETQYDVFLSHNSVDREAVEIIARRLDDEAKLHPFLDKWHLIPGKPWQEAVEEALAQSETVAVFVGPSGISPWHNEEMRTGLDQAVRTRDDYRVIPVLLPGANEESLTGFLSRRTWVDFRPGLDDAEAFERLVAGIKGEAIVSGVYELPGEPSPYRGLLRFEAKHRRFFFGRDADRQRLVEKLEHHRFVAVVGASGSGKSSLVRAGLLPDLGDGVLPGSREWSTLVFTPGSQPLRSLANQLASLAPSTTDRLKTTDDLTQRLAERTDGLRTAVTAYLVDRAQPLLLVVDQFEELFTLCQDKPERCRAQAEQFIANLADAVQRGDGQIRVLVTLRADFLDRCLSFPALRDLLEDRQVLLGPLDEPALREAVVRPAQEVGALFEKGLVSMILRDVEAEPGALPLLQHALYELWQARRGPWLTIDAYEASGGVRGALQRRAQATYDALTPEQQAIARNILLRLTALGEGVSDTRRRVERSELYAVGIAPEQVDAVLQALSGPQARLVVANEASVEVAHEALIQQWDTLRAWLEEDRDALRLHRHLTEAAQEWVDLDRDSGELYRGARLAQATEWAEVHAADMNPLEREFVEASVEDREARRIAARRRMQRVIAGLVAGLVVIGALAIFAWGRSQLAEQRRVDAEYAQATAQADAIRALNAEATADARRLEAEEAQAKAERQKAIAESRALAAYAEGIMDEDPQLAVLLGLEAVYRTHQNAPGIMTAEACNALHRAIARSRWRTTLRSGRTSDINHAAWSSDGARIVTASSDGSAIVWDAQTGAELFTLRGSPGEVLGYTSEVWHAAWSSDDTRIVAAYEDKAAVVWDVGTGAGFYYLIGHADEVWHAVWSSDDRRIVTASEDGSAKVWDADTGAEVFTLEHAAGILHAAWSSDDRRIVTASEDGSAKVWGAETGEELFTLSGHTEGVNHAAWSSDGARIVTASSDGSAIVWDAQTGARIFTLSGHTAGVNHVAWSSDGTRIVTVSSNWSTNVKVWNADTGAELFTLRGHTGSVVHVAWSSDDMQIVTAGEDGSAKVWGVDTEAELFTLSGHTGYVDDVAWSSDDTRIVTASGGGSAKVWDADTGAELLTLSGYFVDYHVAWSSDGTRIMIADIDGARVWDADTGVELLTLISRDTGIVMHAAWSPDGTRIVTAIEDGIAIVWDVDTGQELFTLIRHAGPVYHVAWSSDGTRIVTVSEDGGAKVWDAGTGQELFTLSGHELAVVHAAWSGDDGRIVTASSDDSAKVWDAGTGQELFTLSGHDGSVRHAAWSGDDRRIVTASSDGSAKVWDAGTGEELFTLSGHAGRVYHVAWSSDGTRIATVSDDGSAKVWDAGTGEELVTLRGRTGSVRHAAWSSDGPRIVIASGDGSACIYLVRIDRPGGLIEFACARTERNMAQAEWRRYMGDEPYRLTCPNLPPGE
jgi:WD40 repeat protein/energy-coupling factor transporter ATP-binding protein EcfA2